MITITFMILKQLKKKSLQITDEDYEKLESDELDKILIKGTRTFKKGGIVRYALFMGKMKVILNEDTPIFTTPNKKTSWTEVYNSVFIGKLRLQNGDFFPDTPTFVVENTKQQYPLNFIEVNN